MKVEVVPAERLKGFLYKTLYHRSFSLFMHLLGRDFTELLCSLPSSVKAVSVIYLDSSKDVVNGRAVAALKGCGYRYIYFIPYLHAKLLITRDYVLVGSANFTWRGVSGNKEVILVIWGDYRRIPGMQELLERFRREAVPAVAKR